MIDKLLSKSYEEFGNDSLLHHASEIKLFESNTKGNFTFIVIFPKMEFDDAEQTRQELTDWVVETLGVTMVFESKTYEAEWYAKGTTVYSLHFSVNDAWKST